DDRICDDRLVECRGLGEQWTGDHDPLARIAILEVRIRVICEEGVEALGGVANVKTRLAPIAIENLTPDHRDAVGFECAVVLISALQMSGIAWINRDTLELDGRKPIIHAVEVLRHPRQKLLAKQKIISAERGAEGGALRRDVFEVAV